MRHNGGGPPESPFDIIIATLVAGELTFSFASAAIVLHFQFRSATSPRRHRRLNSMWPVRILLLVLASLLSIFELLRLPLSPRLCAAHSFLSPSLAEPAFFSTLLFLLRASTQPSAVAAISLLSAAASALAVSLPFLSLHILFIFLPNSFLLRLGLSPYFLAARRRNPCGASLFSTALLAALAAFYVPIFISAIWRAVAVVINKRLRTRLYSLSAAVTAALSVQIAARALAALWAPATTASQALNLASFVALLVAVVTGEAILVVQPIVDSLNVVDANIKRLRLYGDQLGDGNGGV